MNDDRASVASRMGERADRTGALARYVVMAMRLIAIALNFLVQLAMAHLMNLSAFGAANTALALLNIIVIPAGLNHEMTALRYVALSRGDLPHLRGLTVLFLRRIALSSLVSCAAIALIAAVGFARGGGESTTAIAMLLVIAPTTAALQFGEGWLRGFGSLVRALVNSGVVVPVGTVVLLLADRFLLQGGGAIGVVGALGARAIATLVALGSVAFFVRAKLGEG